MQLSLSKTKTLENIRQGAYADGLRSLPPSDVNSPIYWESYCKGLWQYHMQKLSVQEKAQFGIFDNK